MANKSVRNYPLCHHKVMPLSQNEKRIEINKIKIEKHSPRNVATALTLSLWAEEF
jgi:hypothetical protein